MPAPQYPVSTSPHRLYPSATGSESRYMPVSLGGRSCATRRDSPRCPLPLVRAIPRARETCMVYAIEDKCSVQSLPTLSRLPHPNLHLTILDYPANPHTTVPFSASGGRSTPPRLRSRIGSQIKTQKRKETEIDREATLDFFHCASDETPPGVYWSKRQKKWDHSLHTAFRYNYELRGGMASHRSFVAICLTRDFRRHRRNFSR